MKSNKKHLLLLLTAGAFINPFMSAAINVALPAISAQFKTHAITLSWVAASYVLTTAIALIPAGRAADIFGRRRVFRMGLIIYSFGSLLCALSPNAVWLIVSRVVQGAGASMIFSTAGAILVAAFEPGERGKVLGINVASVYTGLSLGPFLGGLITHYIGWRAIFYINHFASFAVLLFSFFIIRDEWREAGGERFDAIGAALFGGALFCVMYGFSLLPGWTGGVFVTAGAAALAVFIAVEKRQTAPVIDLNLFSKNRVFALSNLAALIHYSATFAVGFLMSLYLQYVKGLSPEKAGLLLVAQPVVMALFSPLAGKLSDRHEPQKVSSIGMGITASGLILLIFIGAATPISYIIACFILLGFGYALFSSPNSNAIFSSVEKKHFGVASSAMGTMRMTGQMMSLGIVMLLFSLVMGQVQMSRELSGLFIQSARAAFLLFSVLCVLGIFASASRGKIHS